MGRKPLKMLALFLSFMNTGDFYFFYLLVFIFQVSIIKGHFYMMKTRAKQ